MGGTTTSCAVPERCACVGLRWSLPLGIKGTQPTPPHEMDRFDSPKFQALCFAMAACALGSYVMGNQISSAERVAGPQEVPSFNLRSSHAPAQAYRFPVVPASGLSTGH